MSDADVRPPRTPSVRRGDLDALRGFAMILGIALHASLAYFPFPWPVHDPWQLQLAGVLYAAIHGFRMPLFFMLSGFFTMLVLRRRGLRQLLEQRAMRILLPLAIATLTLLPLDRAVISWAVGHSAASMAARNPLAGSILTGDRGQLERQLATADDLSAQDPTSGLTPLSLAAMRGTPQLIEALVDAGADVVAPSRNGSSPLDAAALMGQAEAAAMLVARITDPAALGRSAATALAAMQTPAHIAALVGRFEGLPDRDADDVSSGRQAIRELLANRVGSLPALPAADALALRYQEALAIPELGFTLGRSRWQLFNSEIFDHLWFLWYLCWLVATVAVAAWVGLPLDGRHRWWLVPASCLPYSLMWSPYGPDTVLGLVPMPHLFLFYACFYWFGAATYAEEGPETSLGACWHAVLPLSLLVLFPLGLATIGERHWATLLQPAYAWGMSLGLIGLFRRFFSQDRPAVRWLSDASYWMYLIHLPLVIVGQAILIDQPWPAGLKFLIVLAGSVALTLVSYRWCVRFTPIGWLLNGPRTPPGSPDRGAVTAPPRHEAR